MKKYHTLFNNLKGFWDVSKRTGTILNVTLLFYILEASDPKGILQMLHPYKLL
jgi:hypothetical protein